MLLHVSFYSQTVKAAIVLSPNLLLFVNLLAFG